MMVLLLCLFVLNFAQVKKISWHYLLDATQTETQEALTNGIFHGTYGPITLLSSPQKNSIFLTTLPESTTVCVIETQFLQSLLSKIPSPSQILYQYQFQQHSHIILSDPSLSTCDSVDVLPQTSSVTVSPFPWIAPLKNGYKSIYINVTAPDPTIARVLDSVRGEQMLEYIQHLSSIHSRQSNSQGAKEAEHFIINHYRKYGFDVSTFFFLEHYSENVIAEIRGTTHPDEIVCVGGHYDSRAKDVNSTTQRAPGADDNGSGSSNLLEFARVIGENGIRFERTLRICSFSGEEQGLKGSRAYAKHLADTKVNVVAMFNGDMLGYKLPDHPITIGMKDRYVDPKLLESANQITRIYVPELPIGVSKSCCSDHQAFTENGFSAIGYFENPANASDYPYYHSEHDLPSEINVKQLGLEGKAIMAAAMTYAQAYRPRSDYGSENLN